MPRRMSAAALTIAMSLLACEESAPTPPAGGPVQLPGGVAETVDLAATFANVYTHVLVPGCATGGCHDAATASAALDLGDLHTAYAALVGQPASTAVAAENGWIRVRPGDPERSFLVRKLEGPGVGEGSPCQPPPPSSPRGG